MKRLRSISLITLLAFLGCEEKTQFDLFNDGYSTVVVEGVVSNLLINHKVKLSRTHDVLNGESLPISGASVRISNGRDIIVLNENPIGSGEYFTPLVRFLTGQRYVLQVRYNGQTYLAEDIAVPVEPLQPLEYAASDIQGMYNMAFSETGVDPNYIYYELDWSNTNECGIQGTSCKGEIYYYDLKTIDVHEIYKPTKEPYYFPLGTRIIRAKYSVSEQYKDFLRSLLSETEWRGGVFDTERANPPTNLSNGAIGFFAVSTVLTDTLLVK